jgi:hypothetical protein
MKTVVFFFFFGSGRRDLLGKSRRLLLLLGLIAHTHKKKEAKLFIDPFITTTEKGLGEYILREKH